MEKKTKNKKKKQAPEWQIAFLHWLFAGFVMPFLFSGIFGHIVKGIVENFGVIVWFAILGEAVKFFIIWVSIVYSGKFLTKTFIIKDKEKIVRLATIYLFVVVGGFRLLFFKSSDVINYVFSFMHIISLLVIVPFFYGLSRNYIKNSNEVIEDEEV
jgi:hypothetical protein